MKNKVELDNWKYQMNGDSTVEIGLSLDLTLGDQHFQNGQYVHLGSHSRPQSMLVTGWFVTQL